MKNKEKFKNKIADIVCNGGSLAVDIETNEPVDCSTFDCNKCLFYGSEFALCSNVMKNWANQEYKETNVISYNDSLFLNFIKDDCEYIARDKNGCLYIYFVEPKKRRNYGFWEGGIQARLNNFNIYFPMIKWSNEKPWKISDLKKLKVVKNY